MDRRVLWSTDATCSSTLPRFHISLSVSLCPLWLKGLPFRSPDHPITRDPPIYLCVSSCPLWLSGFANIVHPPPPPGFDPIQPQMTPFDPMLRDHAEGRSPKIQNATVARCD